MSLNFDNGGFAIIHSSWLDPNKVREMIIVGSKKMIVYDDNEPLEKIKIYDKRVETPAALRHLRRIPVLVPLRRRVCPVHQAGRTAEGGVPALPGLHPDKEKPETCGLDGLRVVQILEASSRSLKNDGAKVEIDRRIGSVTSRHERGEAMEIAPSPLR